MSTCVCVPFFPVRFCYHDDDEQTVRKFILKLNAYYSVSVHFNLSQAHTHTHASSTQSIHSLWQTIISLLFCQVVMWSRVDRDLMVIMINKNCSLCIIIKVDCRSIISCIVLYRLLRSLERTHNWKQFSQKLIVCRFGTRVCALLNCFELSFFITWSYG